MARYSSPKDLLDVPGFEEWFECDCGPVLDLPLIMRALKHGPEVMVWPLGEGFFVGVNWSYPFPIHTQFSPTPEGAKAILEWAEWVAKMSGGWLGDSPKETIIGGESLQGSFIPECLVESRSIVHPAFLNAFRDGLRGSGLNGVAVITDPSNSSEAALVMNGAPMIIGACLWGALRQIEPMIAGAEFEKNGGSGNG
jgi:hypothetical protein